MNPLSSLSEARNSGKDLLIEQDLAGFLPSLIQELSEYFKQFPSAYKSFDPRLKSRALILVPNKDIQNQVRDLLQKSKQSFNYLVLDSAMMPISQARGLKARPELIVTQAGLCNKMLEKEFLNLNGIEILCLLESTQILRGGDEGDIEKLMVKMLWNRTNIVQAHPVSSALKAWSFTFLKKQEHLDGESYSQTAQNKRDTRRAQRDDLRSGPKTERKFEKREFSPRNQPQRNPNYKDNKTSPNVSREKPIAQAPRTPYTPNRSPKEYSPAPNNNNRPAKKSFAMPGRISRDRNQKDKYLDAFSAMDETLAMPGRKIPGKSFAPKKPMAARPQQKSKPAGWLSKLNPLKWLKTNSAADYQDPFDAMQKTKPAAKKPIPYSNRPQGHNHPRRRPDTHEKY